MAVKIVVLIIACGAIAAGYGYVRLARWMRSYRAVEGQVIGREVAVIPGGAGGEGRWGSGGRYSLKVTYSYVVDGVSHTCPLELCGQWAQAQRRRGGTVTVPDAVTVFYDPTDQGHAYLHTHTPRIGYALLG